MHPPAIVDGRRKRSPDGPVAAWVNSRNKQVGCIFTLPANAGLPSERFVSVKNGLLNCIRSLLIGPSNKRPRTCLHLRGKSLAARAGAGEPQFREVHSKKAHYLAASLCAEYAPNLVVGRPALMAFCSERKKRWQNKSFSLCDGRGRPFRRSNGLN